MKSFHLRKKKISQITDIRKLWMTYIPLVFNSPKKFIKAKILLEKLTMKVNPVIMYISTYVKI